VVVSEKYEKSSRRRWMWRGPHTLSVQVGCAEVAMEAYSDARLEPGVEPGSAVVRVRLNVVFLVAEEFGLSLRLAAGRDFWRGTALATTAQLLVTSFSFSSKLRWCRVLLGALYACVVVVVVVVASARDVQLLLLK
jgi:hypothetical protein